MKKAIYLSLLVLGFSFPSYAQWYPYDMSAVPTEKNGSGVGSGTGNFKADGSVPMTGALNMGGQNINNIGTATFGQINLDSAAAITTPGSGVVASDAMKFGSRTVLSYTDENGLIFPVQDALWRNNNFVLWCLGTGSASYSWLGGAQQVDLGAIAGTMLNETWADTSRLTRMKRRTFTSSANVAQSIGIRQANSYDQQYSIGSGAGRGGIFYHARVAPVTMTAAHTCGFFGMTTSGTPADSNPCVVSTDGSDMVGFGFDGADSNWSFITRNNSGTAVKTSIGTFATTTTGALLDIYILIPPNSSTVYYRLDNLSGNSDAGLNIVNSSFNGASLPRNNVAMTPAAEIGNGDNSTAVAISIAAFYCTQLADQ